MIQRMKSLLWTIACLLFIVNAYGQKKSAEPAAAPTAASGASVEYGNKEKTFRMALKYGDLVVAKQALFDMIVLKPEATHLKDSLAFVYINLGMLREAILLSREILESTPSNLGIMEVKAISEQNLGLSKEALTTYESLYSQTKNVYHLYQIATLQYDLKRMAECNNSIDQLLATPDIDKKDINIGTGTRGQQQRVLLKAAALNIKGVLAMDLNENAVAKTCFEEALKLTPDFVLAKGNLDFLTKKLSTPDKTTTPAPAPKTKK